MLHVEDKKSGSLWFYLRGLFMLIEAIQLGSLGFAPNVNWPLHALDNIEDVTYLRLNFRDTAFIVFFLILVGFLLLIGLLTFISELCCDLDCIHGMSDDLIGYFFTESVLFGVLFVPIVAHVFEMFHCVNDHLVRADYQCFEGIHIFYFILAVVGLVVILIASFLKGPMRDRTDHEDTQSNRMRLGVRYFNTQQQIYRVILVAMGIFMNEHAETLLSIMFVLSLLWLVYCLLLRIYIEPAYNYLKVTECSIVCWFFACSLAAATNSFESRSDGPLYMFIALPAIIGIAVALSAFVQRVWPIVKEDIHPIHVLFQAEETPEMALSRRLLKEIGPSAGSSPSGSSSAFASVSVSTSASSAASLSTQTLLNIDPNRCLVIQNGRDDELNAYLQSSVMGRVDLQAISIRRKREFVDTKDGGMSLSSMNLIARMLPDNKDLVALLLNDQQLNIDEIRALIGFVKIHPNIRLLDLYGNGLDDASVILILDTLQNHPTLRVINLGDNPLQEAAMTRVEQFRATRSTPVLRV